MRQAGARTVLSRLRHRWAIALVLAGVVVAVALQAGTPSLAGVQRSLRVLESARPGWIVLAVAGSVNYLGCLVTLFRLVAGATPGPHVAHLTAAGEL